MLVQLNKAEVDRFNKYSPWNLGYITEFCSSNSNHNFKIPVTWYNTSTVQIGRSLSPSNNDPTVQC